MREAVELATIVANAVDLPAEVVTSAVRERLAGGAAVSSLAAQAALAGAIGQLAERRVAALLRDPDALTLAASRARQGSPLQPSAIGVTRSALLREAGVAAAALG